jgi:Ser/Thr protein kinase RdoA (MazF antagonist)
MASPSNSRVTSPSELVKSIRAHVTNHFGHPPTIFNTCSKGIASLNYHVQGQSYDLLVRCDFRRTPSAALIDNYYQELAAKAGVRVPSRARLLMVRDHCVVTYRPLIAGHVLSDPKIATAGLLRLSGNQLAHLHNAVGRGRRQSFYAFVWNERDPKWRRVVETALIHRDPGLRQTAAAMKQLIVDTQANFAPGVAKAGVIHGDFKLDNLLATPDENLVVLDWEKSSFGSTLFDLGLALFHAICGDGRNCRLEYASELMAGYSPVTDMMPCEAPKLFSAVELAASAFYLVDIGLAAIADGAAPDQRARRLLYFNSYCRPAYELFRRGRQQIYEWCGQHSSV